MSSRTVAVRAPYATLKADPRAGRIALRPVERGPVTRDVGDGRGGEVPRRAERARRGLRERRAGCRGGRARGAPRSSGSSTSRSRCSRTCGSPRSGIAMKSWKRLDDCVDDTVAAIEAVGAERTLMMGFSMGGAVAVRAASHPSVVGILGLAPWLLRSARPDAASRPEAGRPPRGARPVAAGHSRRQPLALATRL